ncbi:unnamed protein product [Penicillium salamii]|uniref:Uncharacterized protein n=1 Tax=Penicillium salamii TaxID=1612424 RepID=A0A9W4I9Y4_9EURO|nr:unnamed protein product [Penicillium salamii]
MTAEGPRTFTPDTEFAELETPRGPPGGSLSITALARFEFEAGKGNDGTKILMIEWEDDDLTRSLTDGSWHVSWAGKTSVLPADERPSDSLRRFYFLLPPNTTIPPVVTLSYEPRSIPSELNDPAASPHSKPQHSLQLNPLPAIFPPELGATGRAAGKKGVLHTIWAKKRLRVLEKEIDAESNHNVEGIALHMAISEKEWIETNFGIGTRAVDSVTSSHDSANSSTLYPATPVSPISGRKLSDKLKGLKLQTSEKDLSANGGMFFKLFPKHYFHPISIANKSHVGSPSNTNHLLSPQSPDVAVSSFSSFRNVTQKYIHSMPTPDTNPTPTPIPHANPSGPESLKPVALFPPTALQEAQQNSGPTGFTAMGAISRAPSTDSGDELFAKALSPRSPDLPRSPFSFS